MKYRVVFFCEEDGYCPLIAFLDTIPKKAITKCYVRLERLQEHGNNLRRPDADYLRDGIYELRIGLNGINYRLLYFFNGKHTVVLSHGITKEREVPTNEINLAIKRMTKFKISPDKHTHKE